MTANYFLQFALFVAVLQIIDGLALFFHDHKLSVTNYIISGIELIWLIGCVYALFTLPLKGAALVIPVIYIAYVIISLRLPNWDEMNIDFEDPESLTHIRFTPQLAIFSILNGVITCVLVLIATQA